MSLSEERLFVNKYGYFTADGKEYVITDPKTPRPWINVISNGDYSLLLSQNGGGYSWRGNAEENRLTRSFQDVIKDNWGKYIYLRDEGSGDFWSVGWKPVCREPEFFETRHGIGYSVLTQQVNQIKTGLTIFVVPEQPVEVWELTLLNTGKRERILNLFTYLEWNLGIGADNQREFSKIFIDNNYHTDINGFITSKYNWGLQDEKGQPNNRNWEYTAFHAVSAPPLSYDGDKESFIGMYREQQAPQAMDIKLLARNTGRFGDAIASLQNEITLRPGESKTIVYTLGVADRREQALELAGRYSELEQAGIALAQVKDFWRPLLESERIQTPDQAMNVMTNTWLKYQTISCRLWGKAAFYQVSGGYGFRDQLQDCQIFFSSKPELAKKQLLLHAGKQKQDGTVLHWWLTISGEGPETNCSDDLLWLPYITINYLKETADFTILEQVVPYLDGGADTLYEHCRRAINRVFQRFSPRGVPLIGENDWNDGLSAVGWEWRGESFWLGQFLYKILTEFKHIAAVVKDNSFGEECSAVRDLLKESINKYGWDGDWYLQATTDDGLELGSKENEEGWIYLNPQIWAVISGIADDERAERCLDAVEEYLHRDYGTLLLYPAYSKVREDIGYISRYAPGLRENGGVYTHAATWAIIAYIMRNRTEKALEIYRKICPPNRSAGIDQYKAEPYAVPGNTDGPQSPHFGKGSWTWYTGSAQWLHRVAVQWILGIRPDYQGLIIDPHIPANWNGFTVARQFRNTVYQITVDNQAHVNSGVKELYLDGQKLSVSLLPDLNDRKEHTVRIIMG